MRLTPSRVLRVLFAVALPVAACSADDSGAESGDSPSTPSAESERVAGTTDPDECDWPMWGYSHERTFTTPCDTAIDAASAGRLVLDWFHDTADVVTASPAVVDGAVYVGDWSGRFYAIDLRTGRELWTYDTEIHPTVYSGQIVSSAAVTDVRTSSDQLVVFGAGRSVYALDAANGALRWRHDVNPDGSRDDPSEVQSSPVIVEDLVLFGFDGHDSAGVRAGVVALDLFTGDTVWYFDPDLGDEPTGCAGVWGSPTVDLARRLVFFGTANCPSSPDNWGPYSEAMVAIELDTGDPVWTFQPHEPNNDDFDFAGAPNLFMVGTTAAVGLGNKDGHYYAVTRDHGELLWDAPAAPVAPPGNNYSTGGFIGPTAVSGDTIVGATAVGGDCPCLHGISTNGEIVWQQNRAGPGFGAAAATDDIAFVGGTTDFTLRAVRLTDGDILWRETMPGAVAGGVAITADRVVAVSGIREPGTEATSESSGVSSFVLGSAATTSTGPRTTERLPPTTLAPPPSETPLSVAGDDRDCVSGACAMSFDLREPPPGTQPAITLHVRPEPFRLEVRGDGLGDPDAWIRPDSVAAETGAVAYGVFLSVSDDNPVGTLVCILDGDFDCVSEMLPSPPAESYNRVSVLAIEDSIELPPPADGFDRLVTTKSFTPPLQLG